MVCSWKINFIDKQTDMIRCLMINPGQPFRLTSFGGLDQLMDNQIDLLQFWYPSVDPGPYNTKWLTINDKPGLDQLTDN